jgi:choline-glycine betaine transporter
VGQIPWWRVATVILLLVALGISVSAGRTIEALIIAVLTIPSLVLLVLSLVAWRRGLIGD